MSRNVKTLVYITAVLLISVVSKATDYNCDGKDFGSKKGKTLIYMLEHKQAKCTKTDKIRVNEDKGTVVVDKD